MFKAGYQMPRTTIGPMCGTIPLIKISHGDSFTDLDAYRPLVKVAVIGFKNHERVGYRPRRNTQAHRKAGILGKREPISV